MNIAINGFGRIGKLALRAGWDSPAYNICHINELHGDAKTSAHLLEYDTVHGRWDRDITVSEDQNHILIGNKKISYGMAASPAEMDLDGIDLVIDSTGVHKTPELLQPYFDAGVKKVIVAAPVKEGALNIVMGCNDHLYDSGKHHLLTAASCTTNCIAPVIKVLHEKIGIRHGTITTIHDVTNTQNIADAPHKDLRRARSCLNSLIPTTTGSATAISMIYPDLKGKLDGLAVRVPLLNASLTDCVFELKKATSVEEVNGLLKKASEGELSGILGYEEKPLVSADYTNDTRSGIIDALSTMVTNDTQVKLFVWYDNEMGYAARMMELAAKVAKTNS